MGRQIYTVIIKQKLKCGSVLKLRQRSVSKLRQTKVLLQVQRKERVGEQKLSVLPKLEGGIKCLFPKKKGR